MKVLLVTDYAPPAGGAELLTLMLRDGLRRRGHDARLFASTAIGRADGVADYYCFGTTSRFRTLLQTLNPWAFARLRRTLREFRPDVVHVVLFMTQLSPLILPLLRRVPSLYFAVTYKAICPVGTRMLPDGRACTVTAGAACRANRCLPLRDWVPLMLQRWLWRRWRSAFDVIATNSDAARRCLVEEGVAGVEVVHGGVPVGTAAPARSGPPTVVCAARLVREKGVAVLVRAFAAVAARYPDARLLLVGEGPDAVRIQACVDSLGLQRHVSIVGPLSRDEMERRFAAAWVQAVPSLWSEPFGLVAVDAMMRGTPVVAFASGGLTEIVRHGETGLLVPPGDVDALAEAIVAVIADAPMAQRMGAAGRSRALAQFSEAACVDRFLALYERLRRRTADSAAGAA